MWKYLLLVQSSAQVTVLNLTTKSTSQFYVHSMTGWTWQVLGNRFTGTSQLYESNSEDSP